MGTTLQLLRRDDAGVLEELHKTRTADDILPLDKVSFFDEFFTFLKDLGVLSLFETLDPHMRVRSSIGWIAMVGVYVMRILAGLPSIPQTEGLILTDPALMALFGMEAFVTTGTTKRGLSRKTSPPSDLPEVRGAFSGEAMVDALVKCSLFVVARIFNAIIGLLAEKGFFPKHVHAIVDCTDLEATPKFRMLPSLEREPEPETDETERKEGPVVLRALRSVLLGVASVTRKKRPDHRNNRHAPKIRTTVWGWKVWLMFCPHSGIPIAVYVDRINVDDRTWMLALTLQGKANLRGRLASVSFDRGFWDGQTLWHVEKEAQVPFFIAGKSDLEITKEARRQASHAYQQYQKGVLVEGATIATREVTLVTGTGKTRAERKESLVVVGLSGLDCPTYAETPLGAKRHSKSFEAGKLNAAVVMHDPSYPPPKDEKYFTVLTPAPTNTVRDALFAYDRYDDRGIIENTGNKEAKQAWCLESPLEKSEQAVYLHVHFVFLLMALMAAFRSAKIADEKAIDAGEETGMKRYRQSVEKHNRDKMLVLMDDRYAVCYGWELGILMGIQLRRHDAEDAEAVLARYRAADNPPEAPS